MRIALYIFSLLDSYAHLVGMLSWFSRYDKFGFEEQPEPRRETPRDSTRKNKTVLNNVFRR